MSQRANHFKLGVFILSGVAVAVLGLIIFGAGAFRDKGMTAEMYFDESVQGLEIGAPVKYRGVKIGSVTEIGFIQDEYPLVPEKFERYVLVKAEIHRARNEKRRATQARFDINDEVGKGFRARLASQGITGLAYIEFDYLDAERYPIPEIDWEPKTVYVPSAPSQITQIAKSVEDVALGLRDADLPGIATNLDELIVTVQDTVESARVDQLSNVIENLIVEVRETNKGIRDVVNDPEIQAIVSNTLETVERANRSFDEIERQLDVVGDLLPAALEESKLAAERANETFHDERIGKALNDLSTTIERAREASESLPDVLVQFEQTARRANLLVADQQSEIGTVVQDLRAISRNLEELTNLMKRYPAYGMFGDPPPRSETDK